MQSSAWKNEKKLWPTLFSYHKRLLGMRGMAFNVQFGASWPTGGVWRGNMIVRILVIMHPPADTNAEAAGSIVHELQMKVRWESNINVWFPFMYSQKWTERPHYFQNRIIMFCLPFPTVIYLWEVYIFPGSVCLFCSSQICEPILRIYKLLTDTWIRKLELRPCNSQKMNT